MSNCNSTAVRQEPSARRGRTVLGADLAGAGEDEAAGLVGGEKEGMMKAAVEHILPGGAADEDADMAAIAVALAIAIVDQANQFLAIGQPGAGGIEPVAG